MDIDDVRCWFDSASNPHQLMICRIELGWMSSRKPSELHLMSIPRKALMSPSDVRLYSAWREEMAESRMVSVFGKKWTVIDMDNYDAVGADEEARIERTLLKAMIQKGLVKIIKPVTACLTYEEKKRMKVFLSYKCYCKWRMIMKEVYGRIYSKTTCRWVCN